MSVYTRTRLWAETVGTRRLARLERRQRRRAERGDLDSYGHARWQAMRSVLVDRLRATDEHSRVTKSPTPVSSRHVEA